MVLTLNAQNVPQIDGLEKVLFKGELDYYHYKIDGINDCGWGCGYRTLQSLASWLRNVDSEVERPPTLRVIQEQLVKCGDKPSHLIGSTQWIGTNEACYVLDSLYDTPCRIFSYSKGHELWRLEAQLSLQDHLKNFGSPIMCGGTQDNMSRALIGIQINKSDPKQTRVLILDPHYVSKQDAFAENDDFDAVTSYIKDLDANGWLTWRPITSFISESRYNLMAPVPREGAKLKPARFATSRGNFHDEIEIADPGQMGIIEDSTFGIQVTEEGFN